MKRIWTFGIFCILVTIFFTGYSISLRRTAVLGEARSGVDDLTHFLAMDMDRYLFGLNQIFLGIHNVLDSHCKEEYEPHAIQIRHVLEGVLDSNPFITALLVLDSAGRIDHWTGDGTPPSIQDRDYYRVHKLEQVPGLFVGKPLASRVNKGQWIFAASNAFRESDATLKHVIVAIIDLEYFRSNYSGLRLAPGETIAMLSPEGEVYARMPGHQMMMGKQIGRFINDPVESYSFMRVVSELDDKMRGISLLRVKGYPLVMAATYNEDIVLAKWRKSSALIAASGAVAVGLFLLLTFMTARAQQQQKLSRELLQRLAVTDSLTQLANRRHAVESANLEIKKAQRQGLPLSFVLMDLDHFKEINDSYGHEKGDLVLQQVASALRQLCRQTDIVSRFGGEEFLVILSGTDLRGAEASSEKIRKALDEDVHGDFAGIPRVTASFGVAQWHASEADFKDTLRRADRALYQAKRKGRNCIQLDRTFG